MSRTSASSSRHGVLAGLAAAATTGLVFAAWPVAASMHAFEVSIQEAARAGLRQHLVFNTMQGLKDVPMVRRTEGCAYIARMDGLGERASNRRIIFAPREPTPEVRHEP